MTDIPAGEVGAHLAQVRVVADVVAGPVLVEVAVNLRLAGEFLGDFEGFEDGGAVGLAATEIADLAGAGRGVFDADGGANG